MKLLNQCYFIIVNFPPNVLLLTLIDIAYWYITIIVIKQYYIYIVSYISIQIVKSSECNVYLKDKITLILQIRMHCSRNGYHNDSDLSRFMKSLKCGNKVKVQLKQAQQEKFRHSYEQFLNIRSCNLKITSWSCRAFL